MREEVIGDVVARQASMELQNEKRELAKAEIKEKIKEIEKTERILNKLKRKYNKLLDTPLDDIYYGV